MFKGKCGLRNRLQVNDDPFEYGKMGIQHNPENLVMPTEMDDYYVHEMRYRRIARKFCVKTYVYDISNFTTPNSLAMFQFSNHLMVLMNFLIFFLAVIYWNCEILFDKISSCITCRRIYLNSGHVKLPRIVYSTALSLLARFVKLKKKNLSFWTDLCTLFLYRVVINCSMDGLSMLTTKPSSKTIRFKINSEKIIFCTIDEKYYWKHMINSPKTFCWANGNGIS